MSYKSPSKEQIRPHYNYTIYIYIYKHSSHRAHCPLLPRTLTPPPPPNIMQAFLEWPANPVQVVPTVASAVEHRDCMQY